MKLNLQTNEEILNELREYEKQPHFGLKCGCEELDKIMRLDRQRFCIITSNENQGKTTFLNWYTYQMAKEHAFKTLYLSFENPKELFYSKLKKVYEGEEFVNYARYCDNQMENVEELFQTFDFYQKEWGYNILVIDPFESLQDLMQGSFRSEDYASLLERLRQYTQKNNIITIIAAHQKKLKEGDEPTISNIFGSVSFGNKADIIWSIQNNENLTIIKTLKIRHNYLEGVKNGTASFKFNPSNEHFIPSDEPTNDDELFGITPPIQKIEEISYEEIENENKEFLRNSKVTLYEKFKKVDEISLNDALMMGVKYRAKIDKIREIDKVTNKAEYDRLKKSLPSYTASASYGDARIKSKLLVYNRLAVLDFDNLDKDAEQIKEIISQNPYVLYCGKSVGGKGLFALIRLGLKAQDYERQIMALYRDFSQMGLGKYLDESAKDITRLRFISYDERPYLNLRAKIYNELIQTPSISTISSSQNDDEKPNQISEKDRRTLQNIIDDVRTNKLQLTKNHNDTMYIGGVLSSLMGEAGRQYLHIIRAQRWGYNATKLDDEYNYIMANNTQKYTMGAMVAKYKQAKKEIIN